MKMILPENKMYRIQILKIFMDINKSDPLKWTTTNDFFTPLNKYFTDKDTEFHFKRAWDEMDWLIECGYLSKRKNGGGEEEFQINHLKYEACESMIKTPTRRFIDKHLFTIIFGTVLTILAVLLERLIPHGGK